MKLCPERSRNRLHLLKNILTALLLLVLVGCSSGNTDVQPLPEQAEQDQLKEENERLRKELEDALANLENSNESNEIEDTEETSSAQPETAAASVNIVEPQLKTDARLTGEWFYPNFHEEEMNNWTQSLVFNADGSGKIVRTFYIPKDLEGYSTSDPSGEVSLGFSWSLNGDAVHTEYEEGGGFVDYTFSAEQQRLFIKNENGEERSGESYYARQRPSILENYIEKTFFIENIQAQEASLKRKFLGSWYFDVYTWTFNEDGTGTLDIPPLGDHPGEIRDFSYTVTGDTTDMMMTIEWPDSNTSYFRPTIEDGSSVLLQGASDTAAIKLTRTFDIGNCPITEAIIENELSVLSGSIFSDILPEGVWTS